MVYCNWDYLIVFLENSSPFRFLPWSKQVAIRFQKPCRLEFGHKFSLLYPYFPPHSFHCVFWRLIAASWLVCMSLGWVVWFLSSGWGLCIVFLGKMLYFNSTSLHPGVNVGTGEFYAEGNHAMDPTSIPCRRSRNIPGCSCYRNRDKQSSWWAAWPVWRLNLDWVASKAFWCG